MTDNKTERTAGEEAGTADGEAWKYDDHFPDPALFNKAISEASSSVDETAFDENFLIDEEDDRLDSFETLPEQEFVEANLGI